MLFDVIDVIKKQNISIWAKGSLDIKYKNILIS